MNSSKLSWLYTLMFSFLLIAFSSNSFLSSATQISYADHCNSIIPESTLEKFEPALSSFPRFLTGYHTGSNRILSQNPSENSHSLTFYTGNVYRTNKDGVFGIDGALLFRGQSTYYHVGSSMQSDYYPETGVISHHSPRVPVSFRLHGFWSESSGHLCMVGTSFNNSGQGKIPNLDVVLKLSNLMNTSSITTLVTGTLESSSSTNDLSYFEPICIMILPRMNYEYTLVSKEFVDEFSGGNDRLKSLPISSLPITSFCKLMSRAVNVFDLKYNSDCGSAKHCDPFGADVGYLPTVVYLKKLKCLEEEKKLRILVQFPNSSYVGFYKLSNLNRTLIGEATWDDKTNQLCVVACRFLNTTDSLANAQVGDCTTRSRLSFPATWSIRETSSVVGEIWSKKAVNDSGYFNKIRFRSSENPFKTVQGLKYEYTEMNRARNSCSKGNPKKNKGVRYPNVYSRDMQFDMWVKRSKGNSSWGYATPLFVGVQFYQQDLYPIRPSSSRTPASVVQANLRKNSPVNISYKIGIKMQPGASLSGTVYPFVSSSRSYERVEISAEGIYDAQTGQLCMVGCRHIISKSHSLINDSMDCEVLINFQFPPINLETNEGYIKGSIKSTRVESDPFYFEPLYVSSVFYTAAVLKRSISRMDLEVALAIITNTLACVFVGLQLFHVKKHPDVLPFISLVMLLILTLGHMIPLMLNFEALFLQNRERQNVLLGSGGWVEVNEVLVRILSMVAFLLEVRLLQLSWSSKQVDAHQKGSWFTEKSTMFVSLPLYAAGALIFFLVNWRKHRHDVVLFSHRLRYPQHSLWDDLKSYAGLILDGFLLPQILLNGFRNSKEKALSRSFYIGNTFVRLFPHAYDLYRTHSYNPVGSYLYAVPNADFYSTAWNVIIPIGGLMLAAIIYLQQRFEGRCIIPQRFREDEAYEKVAVACES